MKKAVVGVLVGGVVYFAAGAACWMALPWKNHAMKKISEENLVRDTLKVVVTQPGLYNFPNCVGDQGKMDMNLFAEKFRSGPTGLIFIRMAGEEPMSPKNYVIGLLESLGVAAFCLCFLTLTRERIVSYAGRVLMVLTLGIFSWFSVHVPYWNWFFFPADYISVVLLDTLFSFGLLGLALAKFVPEKI